MASTLGERETNVTKKAVAELTDGCSGSLRVARPEEAGGGGGEREGEEGEEEGEEGEEEGEEGEEEGEGEREGEVIDSTIISHCTENSNPCSPISKRLLEMSSILSRSREQCFSACGPQDKKHWSTTQTHTPNRCNI